MHLDYFGHNLPKDSCHNGSKAILILQNASYHYCKKCAGANATTFEFTTTTPAL
jgi:hypothetical protein